MYNIFSHCMNDQVSNRGSRETLVSFYKYILFNLFKARYTRYKFCIQVSIQVFWSCIPYKKLESKNLNGLGWNRNASYFSFNLDGTWMEIDQSEDRILISINLWMQIITTTRVVQRWREKRKLQNAGKRQSHGLMKWLKI
jgi:hypothetical protein